MDLSSIYLSISMYVYIYLSTYVSIYLCLYVSMYVLSISCKPVIYHLA